MTAQKNYRSRLIVALIINVFTHIYVYMVSRMLVTFVVLDSNANHSAALRINVYHRYNASLSAQLIINVVRILVKKGVVRRVIALAR